MDSSRAKTFQQMADELGIRHKLMYTLREAARVTGVPYDTLRIECKAGRLRSQLPEGRKVGRTRSVLSLVIFIGLIAAAGAIEGTAPSGMYY